MQRKLRGKSRFIGSVYNLNMAYWILLKMLLETVSDHFAILHNQCQQLLYTYISSVYSTSLFGSFTVDFLMGHVLKSCFAPVIKNLKPRSAKIK